MSSCFFDLRSILLPPTCCWPYPRIEQTTRGEPTSNQDKHCNTLYRGGVMDRRNRTCDPEVAGSIDCRLGSAA